MARIFLHRWINATYPLEHSAFYTLTSKLLLMRLQMMVIYFLMENISCDNTSNSYKHIFEEQTSDYITL